MTLAKLAALVIQVFSRGEVVELRPVAAVADLDRGEVDGVEVRVVFAHELVKLYVGGVEPPLFPVGR